MNDQFNIFLILSKDDKELIHSAFIKFLISENRDSFFNHVLQKDPFEIEGIHLEKSYTLKSEVTNNKNQRCRIDIEIPEKEGNEIVIIENKFKSFPYPEQLELYDKIYSQIYPEKKVSKYLLCFDKKPVTFELNNWVVIEYSEILNYLKSYQGDLSNDKKIFIKHYRDFLQDYYDTYDDIQKDCFKIFSGSDKKNRYTIIDKFWINLIFSVLRLNLHNYFNKNNIKVKYNISPGNTSTPLINILPQHWKFSGNGRETLIQFQGDLIKFYCHTNDPEFLEILNQKAHAINNFKAGRFRHKPQISNNPKSRYILQVNLHDLLKNPKKFNVNDLFDLIIDFYYKIDEEIMAPSSEKLKSLQLTKTVN